MRVFHKAILGTVLGLGLGGCASTPTADTFEISAPRIGPSVAGRSRSQLLIPEPTAIKALDSDRIVVKPTAFTVEYLGQAQWSDRLPRMVQLRLLQAFENTGRIAAVGVPGQGLAIDYQLVMEVRKFEISLAPGAHAVIEISAKALNDKTGNVARTRIFTAEVPVTAAGNAGYVAALDQAFSRASRDIVAWTLAAI